MSIRVGRGKFLRPGPYVGLQRGQFFVQSLQLFLRLAVRLKDCLLDFRGELVPTEAELAEREGRSYETAEQLLARVKSEAGTDKPALRKRSKSTK